MKTLLETLQKAIAKKHHIVSHERLLGGSHGENTRTLVEGQKDTYMLGLSGAMDPTEKNKTQKKNRLAGTALSTK